jgi:guanylate kinase
LNDVRVVVISGPSGAGKSTLIDALVREEGWHLAVSATTRAPRPGEVEGKNYHFVSQEEFQSLVVRGEFLEWAEVHGQRYGTPKNELIRSHAPVVILDVDTQGYRSVKSLDERVVGIFLMPPSMEALEHRLRLRGSENEQALRVRLENGRREMEARDEYDHVVINDDVARAKAQLRDLVHRTGTVG